MFWVKGTRIGFGVGFGKGSQVIVYSVHTRQPVLCTRHLVPLMMRVDGEMRETSGYLEVFEVEPPRRGDHKPLPFHKPKPGDVLCLWGTSTVLGVRK
jgi:hypothetical protein